jgi:cell division protein FtsB|tara:strand:+ start:31134 stop:31427 length:294 start_codon:yes stop_codon:yes gene_type:complete
MKGFKILSIALLALLLLLQIRLWFGGGSMEGRAILMRYIEEQQSANDRLEARNEVVEREIEEFHEDPEGAVEERAREELGLIKEGETLYLLIEEDAN